LSAFQELQQVAQPKDRVLIYYAGHGHLEESNNDGYFGAIDDPGILAAHRLLSQDVGIFVEPSSAMSVAGLLERSDAGVLNKGATAVLTVTGHGLKDPQWALKDGEGAEIQPTKLPVDVDAVAEELELTGERS
jgi:threonine synthase